MKNTCPSELTTYVRVQRLVAQSDGMGGREGVDPAGGEDQTAGDSKWVDWFQFWAKLDWSAGHKYVNGQRIQSGVVAKMEARYDVRLSNKERLVLSDGQVILLESVTNRNMRNVWMDIQSKAGVGT